MTDQGQQNVSSRQERTEAETVRRLKSLLQEARYHDFIAEAEALGPLAAIHEERRDTLIGHARLAITHNRAAEIAASQKREQSPRWLSTEALHAKIEGAIRQHRPFALIRLGDGEARFTITMTAELRACLTVTEAWAISRPAWDLWFGERIDDVDASALAGLMTEYREAVRTADVLGVSGTERLSSKPNIFGYLAAQEVWLRAQLADRPSILFTDAVAHFRLNDISPFLESLLHGLSFLGLIGPHSELADRLAARFAIPETQSYQVPGESLLPAAQQARLSMRHFPERYREILATLSVPHAGAVFLIAAGLLGKVYCARIKQLGGVALDIGAVADLWMGFDTRPSYRARIGETS